MEIGRSHLGRMIIMILLTILANQVHCSTQPVDVSIPDPSFHPRSPLDHLTHFLEAYVPISFVGTPHYHFSPNQDHGEIERATNYPWQELLGKPLGEAVGVVNQVAPSASIIVKKMYMPGTFLQQKGPLLTVLLLTDYHDLITGIFLLKSKFASASEKYVYASQDKTPIIHFPH